MEKTLSNGRTGAVKRTLLVFVTAFFLGGCSDSESLEVFSFDARTKDVALEDMVLLSNGREVYVQPTYQLFGIEKLDDEGLERIEWASIGIYDSDRNPVYSLYTGENQEGVLDTRAYPLEGSLTGPVVKNNLIKDGEKLYVEFVYEKESREVREEVEVVLEKE